MRIATWVFALSPTLAASVAAQSTQHEFDCLVEPRWRVVVSAPESAVVATMLVDRGDRVEKGQLLATLESSVERATVAQARARAKSIADIRAREARLLYETRRSERSKELSLQGVISDIEQDERESVRLVAEAEVALARDNRRLAELDLKRAEALLERRTIRSPIDGVVVQRMLSPGEYADPLDLLVLAQIDPLLVEVFVPVAQLGNITDGMRGQVALEQPVGTVHTAAVTVVDPVVDAASGTFRVRLELPNPEGAIFAGLKCRVYFEKPPAGPIEPIATSG